MSDLPLLTEDQPSVAQAYGSPQWGLYDQSGGQILTVDSVADIEYVRDYVISDYPQEQGAFESYNKVQTPYVAKLGFFVSTTRRQFLNAVEDAARSLQLISVVTPEITYPSGNITHYSYRRAQRSGVTLLRVEVWVEEVRIVSGGSDPDASNAGANGSASSNTPTPSSAQSGPDSLTNFLGPGGATTPQPIGALVPGTGLTGQSTNSAAPLQSGQVQAIDPFQQGISTGLPLPR